MSALAPVPYAVPTPYQPPSKGGNQYVTPGTIGPSIPASASPVYGPTYSGGVQWSTGTVTPAKSVSGYTGQDNRTYSTPAPSPAPSTNGGNAGGGNSSGGGNNLKNPYTKPGDGWWWDAADGWKQDNQADYSTMISDLYDPALRLADEQEANAKSGFESDKTNLLSRYDQSKTEYGQQGEQLLGDTDKEQTDFNKVLDSAFSQAVRAWNALTQRGNVMYGGSSSTGRAMNELANREYYRQQGQIQNKQAEGTESFGLERTKIKQYIDSKAKDLDLWKQEALTSLETNLKNTLADIAGKRYEIEANRTRDKMAALQDTINRTRSIQDQDKTFRQNLAMAGLNQLQQISGKTFSPAEIKAYISDFGSDLGFKFNASESAGSALSQLAAKPKTYKDELESLNSTGSGNSINKNNTSTGGRYIASSLPNYGGYSNYMS